jgi:hypothetical protein
LQFSLSMIEMELAWSCLLQGVPEAYFCQHFTFLGFCASGRNLCSSGFNAGFLRRRLGFESYFLGRYVTAGSNCSCINRCQR